MNFFDQKEDDDSLDNQDNQEEKEKTLDINIIRATLAKNDFVYLRPIGKGGFASVFLIFSNQYNLNFVVKVSDYKGSRKNPSQDFDLNEINNLINLNHPNIINMYKYFTDEYYLYIVLEYCEGGSLDDLIKQNGPVRPPTLYNYCYQILTALKHCHDLQVSHCDIKPANVLIDKNKRLKLADFGLSKGFSPKLMSKDTSNSDTKKHFIGKNGQILTKNFAGSKPYMSPELIQLTAYDPFKADIWSLGVTFYQLATGHLPWNTYDLKEMRMSITMGVFSFQNTKLPPAFCNIIHRMLEVKPTKRATLEWLLEQSIFSQASIIPEKNIPVSRSPSFGSQLGSFSNVNSFKLGNRPNGGRIKLGHRSRNNSSVNVMESNYSFNTLSVDASGNELSADNLPDVPGISNTNNNNHSQNGNTQNPTNMNLLNPNLLNIKSSNADFRNSSNSDFGNSSNSDFRNSSNADFRNSSNPILPTRTSSNNSFGTPSLQNLRLSNNFANQSSSNSSNAELLNSSSSNLNVPNQNKLNLSGRHLLYSTNGKNALPQKEHQESGGSNNNNNNFDIENYKNTHLNNCSNTLYKTKIDNEINVYRNSGNLNNETDLGLASNHKPKTHRGMGSILPKTFA